MTDMSCLVVQMLADPAVRVLLVRTVSSLALEWWIILLLGYFLLSVEFCTLMVDHVVVRVLLVEC
jgi:hypothetical protein